MQVFNIYGEVTMVQAVWHADRGGGMVWGGERREWGKKEAEEATRWWPPIGHINFADRHPNCHPNGFGPYCKDQ